MAPAEAQDAYRGRKALSEHANAGVKDPLGLRRVRVRGVAKVTCVVLLTAIVFNILQHRHTFARAPPAARTPPATSLA